MKHIQPSRSRAGFSVLEMLIAVTILSMLAIMFELPAIGTM